MKKLALTIAIVLGLGMTTLAGPNAGGLFQRGASEKTSGMNNRDGNPLLPGHGETTDQDADAPLGTGVAIMLGLGAAYLVGKRRKED